MKFVEALELLKDGKCISRSGWSEDDGYLVVMKGMKYIWKIITKPQPNAGNHFLSVEELGATDWIEYDEKRFSTHVEVVSDAA